MVQLQLDNDITTHFTMPTKDRTIPIPTIEELHQAAKSGDLWLLKRWLGRLTYRQIVETADRLPIDTYDEFFNLLQSKELDGQLLLEETLTSVRKYDILHCRAFKHERPLARLVTISIQQGGRLHGKTERQDIAKY